MPLRKRFFRWLAIVGALPIVMTAIAGCNSTRDRESDAAADSASPGTPFGCGDASCVIGESYCRELSSPGGQTGTIHTTDINHDCAPFDNSCAPHDCSCVKVSQGYWDCSQCNQSDAGGVVALCDKV